MVFVGLGLNNDKGISLLGLEEIKTADKVFLECYTSIMPDFSLEDLQRRCGKEIQVLTRSDLEDKNGEMLLKAAENQKVAFLVPGDPLIATTHVALRIEAERRGIRTRLVHGASVLSAAIGMSGLHNYKFGKSVTIPFPDETPSETPYSVISQNKKLGLHTLCLLDIKTEKNRFLTIPEALSELMRMEKLRKNETIIMETLTVGLSRLGSNSPIVKAGAVRDAMKCDYGGPPWCLIFPGKLHFIEAEALIVLAGAPAGLVETLK
jgi:diphthine synthase